MSWNVSSNIQDKANPLATVLSAAMLLRYALGEEKAAKKIEDAVLDALNRGFRTGDIHSAGYVRVLSKSVFISCYASVLIMLR